MIVHLVTLFFFVLCMCLFVFGVFIPQIVDNPAEVAEKADRIITMLPSSPNVIDVYTGPNGILKYYFCFSLNMCCMSCSLISYLRFI